MNAFHKTLAVLVLAGGMAASAASVAWANLAANTGIINTATLSYWDGAATQTSTSSATVLIALVPAGPEILPGPPGETPYVNASSNLDNTFTVRANANGPDNYALTTTVSSETNTTGATATVTSVPNPIRLGATLTLAGSTTQVLQVPADGVADAPGSVNGIEKDDFVFIIDATYQVDSVTDNATGTSTITLTAAKLLPAAPAAGVHIREEKTVTVNVTAGSIQAGGSNVEVQKTLTATSQTDANAKTPSGAVTDTFTSGSASLVKYVCNVSNPNGSGASYPYGGRTYYRDNVRGLPNEMLEYLLVATNNSQAAVTQAFVSDVLPALVTLKSDAYAAGKEVKYVDETSVVSLYSKGAGDDQATLAGNTLTVYIGTGAGVGTGGSLPAASTLLVLYQVTINPNY